MTRFAALLRGINVGGNKKVPMETLREMLEGLGFQNVKTLLNSGNVVFDASETDETLLTKKIEETFVKTFGFESRIMLRTIEEVDRLIKRDPFKEIKVTSDTRLYISFLAKKSESDLHLPYVSPMKDFQILDKTDREVFWFIQLSPTTRTTESMGFVEKSFGKDSTTRNWNTVIKIASI